ncbi:MAG: ribonuclease Z [Methanomassiliicoccales archaeon]
MEILFLGTGATLPSVKRNVSSTAVVTDDGVFLFDCGEGTQRQMMIFGFSFMRIRCICITHLHGDHVLGLPGLIQSMALMRRKEELTLIGPRGFAAFYKKLHSAGMVGDAFPVKVTECEDGWKRTFGQMTVSAAEAKHIIDTVAYRIDAPVRAGKFHPEKALKLGLKPGPLFSILQSYKPVNVGGRIVLPEMVMGKPRPGASVGYAVDTRPTRHLATFMRGVNVLIFDSTFSHDLQAKAKQTGHSTATEAAQIAMKCGAKRLYLTHISARYNDSSDLLKEARSVFSPTFAAKDGMRYRVRMS